jgi:hypothetical protein
MRGLSLIQFWLFFAELLAGFSFGGNMPMEIVVGT